MNLDKPKITVKDTFTKSIDNFRIEKKTSLQKALPELIKAEKNYDDKASCGKICDIKLDDLENTYNSSDDLIKIYTQKFSKKDHPAREYYEKILMIPKLGKCPYCGHRNVSNIDHYLDKIKYPKYTVTPYNLIPVCNECNKLKHTDSPKNNMDYYIHPYYDIIDDYSWLESKVIFASGIVVEFMVAKDDKIPDITYKKILYHFKKLKLAKLYSIEANNELSNKAYRLKYLFESEGKEAVRNYLFCEYESCYKNNKNSWQTALYRALSEDEKFYGNIIIVFDN